MLYVFAIAVVCTVVFAFTVYVFPLVKFVPATFSVNVVYPVFKLAVTYITVPFNTSVVELIAAPELFVSFIVRVVPAPCDFVNV